MYRCVLAAALGLFVPLFLHAQDKTKSNASPEEKLEEAKNALINALKAKDLEAALLQLHKDAVVIWPNGEVSRGHQAIREYCDRMLTGPTSLVEKGEAAPEFAKPDVLHGDPPHIVVCVGLLNDKYALRDGNDVALNCRASVVFVRVEEKWVAASVQMSADVLDNDFSRLASGKSMWLSGGIVGILALVLGVVIGRQLAKK